MKTRIMKNDIPAGKSNNIPAGNWEDKYNTKNPVGRLFIDNFIHTIKQIIGQYRDEIHSITETGCGEGNLTKEIHSLLPDIPIKGCDFSEDIIDYAKNQFPGLHFYKKNIYNIGEEERADLIVCCEVLEHLEFPGKALKKLNLTTKKYCLLSVPQEPLWRILNMARGKYLRHMGNTPGHIQHWSTRGFIKLIQPYMDIIQIKTPVPWTIVLCKKKKT